MVDRALGEVGYQTDTAFSRAFRREYGVPPAAWRRRQAGAANVTPDLDRLDRVALGRRADDDLEHVVARVVGRDRHTIDT